MSALYVFLQTAYQMRLLLFNFPKSWIINSYCLACRWIVQIIPREDKTRADFDVQQQHLLNKPADESVHHAVYLQL